MFLKHASQIFPKDIKNIYATKKCVSMGAFQIVAQLFIIFATICIIVN
jgi:hypothetical protein